MPPIVDTIHPGCTPAARGAALRIDGGDDQLPADQPHVESGLPAQVDVPGWIVWRRRNDREVREAEAAEHVGEDDAKLAGRFRLYGLRTQFRVDAIPVGDVERRIEMAVADDLPYRVEGLRRLVGSVGERRNGRGDQQREQPRPRAVRRFT